MLAGAGGPQRDIVLVNAAAALVAAGKAVDFREGVSVAGRSIDSGAARRKAEELARFTLPRVSLQDLRQILRERRVPRHNHIAARLLRFQLQVALNVRQEADQADPL